MDHGKQSAGEGRPVGEPGARKVRLVLQGEAFAKAAQKDLLDEQRAVQSLRGPLTKSDVPYPGAVETVIRKVRTRHDLPPSFQVEPLPDAVLNVGHPLFQNAST